MITEFKENPGTIWGFEDIRLPFVQAAHATAHGLQPLRMMELWQAGGSGSSISRLQQATRQSGRRPTRSST